MSVTSKRKETTMGNDTNAKHRPTRRVCRVTKNGEGNGSRLEVGAAWPHKIE